MDAHYQKHESNNIDISVDIEKKDLDGPEYILYITLTNRLQEQLTRT